jgi:hypothetical protein
MNRAEGDVVAAGPQLPPDQQPPDQQPSGSPPSDQSGQPDQPSPDSDVSDLASGLHGMDRDLATSDGPENVSDRRHSLLHSYEETSRRARNAAAKTAADIWKQVPTLLPLLGVLFYGLGRLMVDGFYTRLNTTAEAAGLGYLSIIEPAAVLAAVLAVAGTAIAMIFDVLKVFFLSIMKYSKLLASLLTALASFGAVVIGNYAFRNNTLFSLLLPLAFSLGLVLLRFLMNVVRSIAARESGFRVLAVSFSLIFLAVLCFGAHEWGVREAQKVEKGQSVDIKIGGLDMSAISALPVQIRAIDMDPTIKQLSTDSCLLEIGSGPYSFLIYDPAKQDVLSVPSNAVVVISSSAACKQ